MKLEGMMNSGFLAYIHASFIHSFIRPHDFSTKHLRAYSIFKKKF